MDKTNVMKALSLCGTGSETCTGCPYYGMSGCDRNLCDDALSLLKAKETKPQYRSAYRFSKVTNLLKYLSSNYQRYGTSGNPEDAERIREWYAREREVQLILLVRHEEGNCICRIKCPVNPLPIKGEFVVTNAGDVSRLLIDLGWTFKDKLNLVMFK